MEHLDLVVRWDSNTPRASSKGGWESGGSTACQYGPRYSAAPVTSVLNHGADDVPRVVPIDHECGPIRIERHEFDYISSILILVPEPVLLEGRFLIVVALGDDKITRPRPDHRVYDDLIPRLKLRFHTLAFDHQGEGTGTHLKVRLKRRAS